MTDKRGSCLIIAICVGLIAFLLAFLLYPHSTEGIVTAVDYRDGWGTHGNKVTITFDDERTLRLIGQPPKSIIVGKYHKITYNNLKFFYSVE